MVLLPVQWHRQGLITKEIYFAQTLRQLGKETILIPTQPIQPPTTQSCVGSAKLHTCADKEEAKCIVIYVVI